MTDERRTLRVFAAATLASAALVIGCGGDDDDGSKPKAVEPASEAAIARDPYALQCAHVRDQVKWDRATRRASVAIVNEAKIDGLNQLQATQSLFYAMTEICKGQPSSFEPAREAVAAVQAGKYRADLGTP